MSNENPTQIQIQEISQKEPTCQSCEQLQKKVIKYKTAAVKFHNELKTLRGNIDQGNFQNQEDSDEILIIKTLNTQLVEQNLKLSQELQEFKLQMTIQNLQHQEERIPLKYEENQLKKQQQDSFISQQFEICIQNQNKNVRDLEERLAKKKAKIKSMKLQEKQNLESSERQINLLNKSVNTELQALYELLNCLDVECKQFFNISISSDVFKVLHKQVNELSGQINHLQNIININNYQFSQHFGLIYSPESIAEIKSSLDQENKYHNERYIKLKEQLMSKINAYEQHIQDLEEQDLKNKAQIKNLTNKNYANLLLIQKLKEDSQDLNQSFNSIFENHNESSLLMSKSLQYKHINFGEHDSLISPIFQKQTEHDKCKFKEISLPSSFKEKNQERNNYYLQKQTPSQKVSNQDKSTQAFDLQFRQMLIQETITNRHILNTLSNSSQMQQKYAINNFNIYEILTFLKKGIQLIDRKEIYQICTLTYDPQSSKNYSLRELQSCQIRVSPYLIKLPNKQHQTIKLESNCQLMQLRVKDDSQFKEKYYIIKQYQLSSQPYKNLQSVLYLASNNKLLDFIVKKFEVDIQQHNIQNSPHKIPQSFILKNRDTENYYYIEELVKSQQSILLKEDNNDSWIHNAVLSLYSFYLSQGRAMITNIDTVDCYYYDTYISTREGSLSPFDQGEEGIQRRLQYVNQHKDKFAKYKKILEQF